MSKQAKVNLSRRSFIARAGALTTGAIAGGTVAAALATPSKAEAAPAAPVPWPLARLNPDVVRDDGYNGYWDDDKRRLDDKGKAQNYGCAYGVAKALITELLRKFPGSVWETLPLEMFKWGKTGCVESGTLCGALAGAMPIFTLVAPESNVEMGSDLLRWYQETALPSREMDYLDPNLTRRFPNQPQSTSASPLCHVSVSSWCKVSGKLSNSTERKTRCAKITGGVAKKAAEILNRYQDLGTPYVSLFPVTRGPDGKVLEALVDNNGQPLDYASCVHCHVDKPPTPIPADKVYLNNSLGISNCKTCHPDAAPVMSKK
jgi:hypothetical protein